ncbi:MAG: hypothetical protein DLM55_01810 [Acidimicrobiales bacterium]|nr:MAG: hypothetical protein DLM55_01810 [Acidimicrobiales bacterium]
MRRLDIWLRDASVNASDQATSAGSIPPRHAQSLVETALRDTRVVLINGARQAERVPSLSSLPQATLVWSSERWIVAMYPAQ